MIFSRGEGKFYKANLHCHTVISDGKLTKEQIREEYRKKGDYSIVAFTDHRTYGYHPELTDETFIALAGIEVDISEDPEKCGGWPHAKCYHLNFYDEQPEVGKEFPLPTYAYEDMAGQNAYIKERTDAGFCAVTIIPTGPCRIMMTIRIFRDSGQWRSTITAANMTASMVSIPEL